YEAMQSKGSCCSASSCVHSSAHSSESSGPPIASCRIASRSRRRANSWVGTSPTSRRKSGACLKTSSSDSSFSVPSRYCTGSHGCVIRLKEGASVVTVDLKAVGTGVAEFVARQVATTVLVEKQDQFACQPIRFFRLPRRDAV